MLLCDILGTIHCIANQLKIHYVHTIVKHLVKRSIRGPNGPNTLNNNNKHLKTTHRPLRTNCHQQGLGLYTFLGVVKNSIAPRNAKKS